MIKQFFCFLVFLFYFSLYGCASIVTGSNQSISVETPGCPGAKCKLSNDKGVWYVAQTPASVTVHRAYGDLTVICSKEDYVSDGAGSASSSTKGMAFGNILFGGFIGAGVDIGTGAAYDYPSIVSIPMDCSENNAAHKNEEPVKAVMDDLQVNENTTAPDHVSSLQPNVQRCADLEQKMEEAKGKAFTLAVLQENYNTECSIE